MNGRARYLAVVTALNNADPQNYWKILREYHVKGWYQTYLLTDHWQAVRERTLRRDRYRCRKCGARTRLEVHHVNYDRIGKENPTDLLTLCYKCHRKEHDK